MTIINVMVDDQRLEFSSMPVVASEGVKETYVKFALSSDWSGFGATAIFYRDDSPEDVYTSVLDGAGLAEVPYEITAVPGWIRFGLSGSDGTSVHTSEILKYKIVKGKYTSGQSSEPPAPGIYEQMLAIAGQMRDTLNASVIEQNAIIQGLVSDMDDLRSDMETEQTTFESVVTGQINTLVNNFAGSSRETILFEGSHTVNIGDEIDLVSDPTVYDYLDIVLNDGMVGTIVGPTQNSQWRVTGETVKSTGTSVTTYVIEGVLDAQSLCLRVSTACAIVDTGTSSTRYDLGSGPIADESLRRYCLKVIGRKLTDDAEVLNIRVGADGVTYQTAGTAVRSQLDKKLNAPISGGTVDYGTSGQLLATDGQGNTEWVDSVIPDGSITVAKLAPGVIDTTYQIQGAAASSVTVGQSLATKANAADVTALDTRVTALESCVEGAFDVETHVSENLLNVEEIETGCYYWTNGKNTNASYNSTPLIPVTPGQTLWFQYGYENAASRQKGNIRFAVGYNADGVYVSGSEKGSIYSYVVPDGVSYVRFSINFNTLTEAQKPVIIAQDEDVVRDYIPYFAPYTSVILKSESDSDQTRQNTTDIEELRQQISVVNGGKAIFSVKAASVNANANLICCDRCDNKKNEYIELTANFSTFGNLTIAHGKDAYMGGYITITPEKIIVYSYNGTQYEEFTHGLTLSDFINVIIYTKNINTCRSSISIMSSGGDYTAETTRYYSCRAAVLCNADFAMTNVEMRYTVNDAAEDVWVFGDSYISLGDPNRWANQMMLAGHKNALLCGYGGAKSRDEILSFRNLIAVAKPQYVVWTLGMNDGDSSTAINAEWKTYADEVIATCENNGVVPILATIPNVPNIIHTFKNAYVRESGKRYVDFAKAVNAESAGASWYTGMLSSDNTHPTALGAKALMRQFLLDVPEVLYTEK